MVDTSSLLKHWKMNVQRHEDPPGAPVTNAVRSRNDCLNSPQERCREGNPKINERPAMGLCNLACYISHVIGSSSFYLPFGMALCGPVPFIFLLVVEAYSVMTSIYYQEVLRMGKKDQSNYFTTIKSNLPHPDVMQKIISLIYIIDVCFCSGFYFQTMEQAALKLVPSEYADPETFHGVRMLCFIATSSLLLLLEMKSKARGRRAVISSQFNIIDSHVEQVNANEVAESGNSSSQEREIDMSSVSLEMVNFDGKRMAMLFLWMLVGFCTLSFWQKHQNPLGFSDLHEINMTGREEFIQFNVNSHIALVLPIILYSLMNYAYILPVNENENMVNESKKEDVNSKKQPCRLYFATGILVLLYSFLALTVYQTFGSDVSVFYPASFKNSFPGYLINFVCLLLTFVGMLLRIIACCKLIQVLLIKEKSEKYFFIIVLCVLAIAIGITVTEYSVLQLIVIAGCTTSNLLMVIFPCAAFLWSAESKNYSIKQRIQASLILLYHLGILISTPFALHIVGEIVH